MNSPAHSRMEEIVSQRSKREVNAGVPRHALLEKYALTNHHHPERDPS